MKKIKKMPKGYDLVEVTLSPKKRTVLKRALTVLRHMANKNGKDYGRIFGIRSSSTISDHIKLLDGLLVDFNLDE